MPWLSVMSRTAAALIAAVLLVSGSSCGGGDDGATPTPSATGNEPASTPDTGTTGAQITGAIDLAYQQPAATIRGANTDDLVSGGGNLALGDFNDDDKPDLLIGAPQADGPEESRQDAGEAYVIFGPIEESVDLAKQAADVTIYGAETGDGLGFTVLAGDLNADGVDDVLVGAQGVSAGFDLRTDQGRVYVFYGGDLEDSYDLSEDVFDFTVTGAEGFSRLSYSMDLGDVDGDGAADLVVGAPFAGRAPGSPPGSQRTGLGEVYVIFGSRDLSGEVNIAALQQDVLLSGAQGPPKDFGQFGSALAVADLDDDGTDDIIVGSHRYNASDERTSSGAAFIFFGRSEWPERLLVQDGDQDATILGASTGAQFGFPITSGDFNGDGTSDVAIGAQLESDDEDLSGATHIFLGGSGVDEDMDLASDQADVTVPGLEGGGLLPSSLAASDLDGDGDDELVLSAMIGGAALGRISAGVVYVVPGDTSLAGVVDLKAASPGLRVIGATGDDRLGAAVAADAILDDRRALVLLANQAGAGGRANTGVVYVFPLELQ